MSKGVICKIHIPYMLAKRKHRERTNSANGTQGSKVTKVESSMIETEATELKHKDFVVALYLTGRHNNRAEEQAHSHKTSVCSRIQLSVGCTCMQARTNLDNYASIIYDT